jgi:hypothetical protein
MNTSRPSNELAAPYHTHLAASVLPSRPLRRFPSLLWPRSHCSIVALRKKPSCAIRRGAASSKWTVYASITLKDTGDPVVLLPGNDSMSQDFEPSGLVDLAAKEFRVFALPRFRPQRLPVQQSMDAGCAGRLDRAGLAELRISEAVILGHPWGASVCGRFGDQTSRVGPCASSRVQILLSELETGCGRIAWALSALDRRHSQFYLLALFSRAICRW